MAGPVRHPIDIKALEQYLDQHVPEIKTPIELNQVKENQKSPLSEVQVPKFPILNTQRKGKNKIKLYHSTILLVTTTLTRLIKKKNSSASVNPTQRTKSRPETSASMSSARSPQASSSAPLRTRSSAKPGPSQRSRRPTCRCRTCTASAKTRRWSARHST